MAVPRPRYVTENKFYPGRACICIGPWVGLNLVGRCACPHPMMAAHLPISPRFSRTWELPTDGRTAPFNIGDDRNMASLAEAGNPRPDDTQLVGWESPTASITKADDGASSRRQVNRGRRHWIEASNGPINTRVDAHVSQREGRTCLWPSSEPFMKGNRRARWVMLPRSSTSSAPAIANGTINGEDYVFAACRGVIANRRSRRPWNLIPSPGDWARSGYMSMAKAFAERSRWWPTFRQSRAPEKYNQYDARRLQQQPQQQQTQPMQQECEALRLSDAGLACEAWHLASAL